MNAATFSGSLSPGEASTPLLTSTPPGADRLDRFGHVARLQATRQDQRARVFGANFRPVEGLALSPGLSRCMAVQQEAVRVGVVLLVVGQGAGLAHRNGLDPMAFEPGAQFRRFAAVILQAVERDGFDQFIKELRVRVEHDRVGIHERRQDVDDRTGDGRFNISRAGLVEHQPDGIGARFGGEQGVGRVRNAADFDTGAHGQEAVRL